MVGGAPRDKDGDSVLLNETLYLVLFKLPTFEDTLLLCGGRMLVDVSLKYSIGLELVT